MPEKQDFQIPQELREFAEKNIEQARVAYGQLTEAMTQAVRAWSAPSTVVASGFKVVQDRAIQFAKENADAGFSGPSGGGGNLSGWDPAHAIEDPTRPSRLLVTSYRAMRVKTDLGALVSLSSSIAEYLRHGRGPSFLVGTSPPRLWFSPQKRKRQLIRRFGKERQPCCIGL